MTDSGDYRDKTRDELLIKLEEMTRSYNSLNEKYENSIIHLKESEYKSRVSEEIFRKAFITSPDSVNINRLSDGMYVSVNDGFTRAVGYTGEEIVGKTSIELNIWADQAKRIELVKLLQQNGKVENFEAVFRKKDGTVVSGLMSASLIELNGEQHILNITRDISEIKIAERAIQASETRYREIIELAIDGILLGSTDGTILSANSYMFNLTGRTPDQLIGKNISSLYTDEVLRDKPLRYDLLEKGETVTSERKIIRPDGRIVPIEMHTRKMPDGTYQSIYHDITERKESEKALLEREEWFRTIFEQSSDGIFFGATDGRIIDVNKSFAELHGYTADEIKEMNIGDLDTPETKKYFLQRMYRLMNGENLKFEVEHFHKDGHRIPLEVSAGLIKIGSARFIMASHRDISERIKSEDAIKTALDRAESSDRLKTSFLNNISHEVRTPLNGILGFAEIIARDNLSEGEKREALSVVYDCSDRLINTITNYMDISLLTSCTMSLNKKVFNPVHILTKLFRDFEPKCKERNLELLLEIPDASDTININTDQELFQKIMFHLIDNAVKFTQKGFIKIGLACLENSVEFFVRDSGIGIGKNFINSIFDRFMKEDRNEYVITEGSGLGLSIAKGISELIGGNIRVESEMGTGSDFYLSLPLFMESEKPFYGSNPAEFERNSGYNTILIAEDDEINFLYLKTLLSHETNSRILHARNGREAIELFRADPDIYMVFMDIKMPEMNGFEAAKQIKILNQNIPIIAITAYAMLGDEDKVMSSGFDGYLSKPITKNSLLEKIGVFVNK